MSKVKRLPPRSKVKQLDTWDLSSLLADDEAWDAAFAKWERRIANYAKFRGTLAGDVASSDQVAIAGRSPRVTEIVPACNIASAASVVLRTKTTSRGR